MADFCNPMTVIVTKLSGGISQIFNPDSGKITSKCKTESGFLKLEAFGGIVKFNKSGSNAIVFGFITSTEDCEVIKENDDGYKEALYAYKNSQIQAKEKEIAKLNQEISQL